MARGTRGPFGRGDRNAALAYARSVLSGAGTTRRTVNPEAWSDAYLFRIANRWRLDSETGTPLTLQAARRGPRTAARPGAGEHPRQVQRRSGLVSRTYAGRSVRYVAAWIARLPGYPNDAELQVTARGVPLPTYGALPFTINGGEAPEEWRTILTGFGGIAMDYTEQPHDTRDVTESLLTRLASGVFEEVTAWEVRWWPQGRKV